MLGRASAPPDIREGEGVFQKLTEAHPTDSHLQADLGAPTSVSATCNREGDGLRRRSEQTRRHGRSSRGWPTTAPPTPSFSSGSRASTTTSAPAERRPTDRESAIHSFDRARAIFQKLALSDPTFTDYEARLGIPRAAWRGSTSTRGIGNGPRPVGRGHPACGGRAEREFPSPGIPAIPPRPPIEPRQGERPDAKAVGSSPDSSRGGVAD